MNKQELIESMQEHFKAADIELENPRSDADDEFVASIKKRCWGKAIQYAKRLDEPQKAKVPEFVSKEIEYYREHGFTNSQIIEDAYNSNVPNTFTEWYWNGNRDLFFDAVAFGCEVAE